MEQLRHHRAYMRGLAALSPAKIKLFKQAYPMKGSWGTVATSTPKRQGNNIDPGEGGLVAKQKTEPIVAFSRPPPLPPNFLIVSDGEGELGYMPELLCAAAMTGKSLWI
ncbi:hypothetical protein Prudu_014246 [Prunus dulcis]|uniref:Uncharacterized protein n=1 Tax=Prunus dulcis TaxID=3755 RepID=A0A4Y1RGG1_PRUDU|nr:hypothetical protein Prudu_014246 [Prunus dulcis]